MNYRTGEHDGQLCVIGPWQRDYEKPEEFRHYWPLGLCAKDWPDLMDKDAQEHLGCVYSVGNWPHQKTVRLPDGEKTKSVLIETRAVKRPKWGKTWVDGEWKRY
jgi:hypothetical protein